MITTLIILRRRLPSPILDIDMLFAYKFAYKPVIMILAEWPF